ncbi:hypothetical protein [Mucilaginibacter myungsuensis]|uniref:Lipoprotein n=1 Tax=Mucilaginibacter myungsuensis TaxID=649104 RepID=A0A929L0R9_9SPHI|nr:hypothetical protein [Mucilaginibacter myungsuensis]MBE9663458.1 hypothetical protein [Mucilaginibacter myungsuensis]MDN3600196.1 hypothetical protein [Mucilaginibacter myungsuensis]
MKKLTILSLVLLTALSFTACRKNCCDAGPQPDLLTAKKGSAEWVSKTQEINTYNDSLFVFGNVGEQHLRFRIKFTGVGKYVLEGSQANYTETIGGDVTAVEYHDDPAAESVLNIIGYDKDNKIYVGNFTLNLQRGYRYDPLDAYYPQKLAFTNGNFKITLAK